MNQLTETLKSMEGMSLPDKTTFGTYNYLTPGPKHSYHPKRTEKLARRLKRAADSLEDVPKLSMMLLIISASLMRNEASRSLKD
jgi:hypothetical protein